MTGSMCIKSTKSWRIRSPFQKLRTVHSGIYDLGSEVLNDTAYEHTVSSLPSDQDTYDRELS